MPFGVRIHPHEDIVLVDIHFHCHVQVAAFKVGVEVQLIIREDCWVHPDEYPVAQLLQPTYEILLLVPGVLVLHHLLLLVEQGLFEP